MGATSGGTEPDPEVPERERRQQVTAEYKERIVREADACRAPGEVGALLRREALYSSHLVAWPTAARARRAWIRGRGRRHPRRAPGVARPMPHGRLRRSRQDLPLRRGGVPGSASADGHGSRRPVLHAPQDGERLTNWLRIGARRLGLFGSLARGEARADSEVDLLLADLWALDSPLGSEFAAYEGEVRRWI